MFQRLGLFLDIPQGQAFRRKLTKSFKTFLNQSFKTVFTKVSVTASWDHSEPPLQIGRSAELRCDLFALVTALTQPKLAKSCINYGDMGVLQQTIGANMTVLVLESYPHGMIV